jgi:hypothetical protein
MFHLWTHPFNIGSDPRNLLRGLELIFQEVRALRDSGLIVNYTMGGLAEKLDGDRSPSTETRISSGVPG